VSCIALGPLWRGALRRSGRASFDEEEADHRRPKGEAKPTKYWSQPSTLTLSLAASSISQVRWRIEQIRDLKQDGLGHYEGRGAGFHHSRHAGTQAYGFLISERERIPPQNQHSARSNSKISRSQWLADPRAPPSDHCSRRALDIEADEEIVPAESTEMAGPVMVAGNIASKRESRPQHDGGRSY